MLQSMYLLISITCLLSTVFINGLPLFSNDDARYNPCELNSYAFFYPHGTDIHKYYQCDEFGNAYLRSCGDLIWDRIHMTCSWPFAVIRFPSRFMSTWETSRLPSTIQRSSTIPTLSSLCKPINPCGAHGKCIESYKLALNSYRSFTCVCSDNWFGLLCDKKIDGFTTLTTVKTTQIHKFSSTKNNIFSPLWITKDPKSISYHLQQSSIIKELDRPQKAIYSNIKTDAEISYSIEEPNSTNTEALYNVEEVNLTTSEATLNPEESKPENNEASFNVEELNVATTEEQNPFLDEASSDIQELNVANTEVTPKTEEVTTAYGEASSTTEEPNPENTEATSKAEEPNSDNIETTPTAEESNLINTEATLNSEESNPFLDEASSDVQELNVANTEVTPKTEEVTTAYGEASSTTEQSNSENTEATSKAEEPNSDNIETTPTAEESNLINTEATLNPEESNPVYGEALADVEEINLITTEAAPRTEEPNPTYDEAL
ncbi:unnamed protein product, partial [Rotaria sp. Silwood2]